MKLPNFIYRRLPWFNVPGALLVMLLQRTPALRVLVNSEEFAMSSPVGALLRSAVAASALGAVHSLAGATQFVQSPDNPVRGEVGKPLAVSFTIIGSPQSPNQFSLNSDLPPGLSTIPAAVRGTINSGTPTISGTPTQAGTFTVTVTGSDGIYSQTDTIFFEITGGTASNPPSITAQPPSSRAVAVGGSTSLSVTATDATSFQWMRNGTAVANNGSATTATLNLSNVQPANAGLYTVVVTNASGTVTSTPSVVGVSSNTKLVGTGQEFPDIPHPNKNIFDQILMGGSAIAVKADSGQAVRISFIDLTDDIVQLEFSGAGTLTLTLDNSTPPAPPAKYNQPGTSYMKGHPTIVITDADQTTNIGMFSVGRSTAFDPTGAYDILLAPSPTNVPANNGSSLFAGGATGGDGFADFALIAIASSNGQFGGIRAANATCFGTKGFAGVYAPGVQFTGPLFVNDINASDAATPALLVGSVSDARITGGDLQQDNGRAVQVSGLAQLQFRNGSDSRGTIFSAQAIKGTLEQNGANVTGQIAQAPTP